MMVVRRYIEIKVRGPFLTSCRCIYFREKCDEKEDIDGISKVPEDLLEL